jgi:hypothetical protein
MQRMNMKYEHKTMNILNFFRREKEMLGNDRVNLIGIHCVYRWKNDNETPVYN